MTRISVQNDTTPSTTSNEDVLVTPLTDECNLDSVSTPDLDKPLIELSTPDQSTDDSNHVADQANDYSNSLPLVSNASSLSTSVVTE